MPSPFSFEAARKFWLSLTGAGEPASRPIPPVVVHDPAAQGPHDLDDPFYERDVQARIGDVIAKANDPARKDNDA